MATNEESFGDTTEFCANCNRSTPHSIELELVTESGPGENARFSREPYRSSECQICGETETIRMNNA